MGLFKKNKAFATLNLKARLQPTHRGEYYEDDLGKLLKKAKIGTVDGGGTLFTQDEGPLECDVEITYYKEKEQELINLLKTLPAPKGSKLILEDSHEEIGIGDLEGLAIYLNGTELDEKVYKECDVNYVVDELCERMSGKLALFSYWTGNKETALYFYGSDFEGMKTASEPFLSEYPLCQKCRILQIA